MKKCKKDKNELLHKIRMLYALKYIIRHRKNKKQQIVACRSPRPLKSYKYTRVASGYRAYSYSVKKASFINNPLMPKNLKYLLNTKSSPFCYDTLKHKDYRSKGYIVIPQNFSIIDNPEESFYTIQKLVYALFIEDNSCIKLDYQVTNNVELSSQVLVDIILKDYLNFVRTLKKQYYTKIPFTESLSGININNEDVQKMLFSVGTPRILGIRNNKFADVEEYPLCVHDNETEKDRIKRMEKKELDTSEMADYVINSLKRMNKCLTSEKRDDLCIVIGEILINAEEHATTNYRYSIGYFKEEIVGNKHLGIFRLVILNFGKTIYEKFKSEDCPNKDIVNRMEELSEKYTKREFFKQSKFDEETLWTLYALQEGVTSVSSKDYKRGNGSIRFIDSFFNIKGSPDTDNISKMVIASGNSRIIFDGTYRITTQQKDNQSVYKVMAFNDSGSIEDKPDNKYVYKGKYYFPGTLISAKILLNDDDSVLNNN
ncbi:MAG: hypothetical protein J5710_10370 [Treponema sp.]|nr:hypothetical protein [Treponema sp.]